MSTHSSVWLSLSNKWKQGFNQRTVQIHFDTEKCTGCRQCYEVCPVGNWLPQQVHQAVFFKNPELCIACGACVLQCPEGAIVLR